jgi:protein O-GlcNAc transferase
MASSTSSPEHINALLQQAVAHHQQGRLAEAEKLYRQVLALAPAQPDATNLLGMIAHHTGHLDAAVELMTRAVALDPNAANFRLNLANALYAKGDLHASATAFRRVLDAVPEHIDALLGLGLALIRLGQHGDAEKILARSSLRNSGRWEAAFYLGCAYQEMGRWEPAVESYERALKLQPGLALALSNLGIVKSQLRRFTEAEADLRRALEIEPNFAAAHLNLGMALLARDKIEEAIACLKRSIALDPSVAEAYNSLGRALQAKQEFDEQVACCEIALKLRPNFASAMVNLGSGLREQGRTAEAMEWFQRAAAIDPADPSALSNIQSSMVLLPGYGMSEIADASRAFWSNRAPEHAKKIDYSNSPQPQRRLKVGYVSGDFRRHAVAYFMEPILAAHDKQSFEVFCYYNHDRNDDYTQRFKALADEWRPIFGLSDAEVVAQIEADGIDILVDLSGHTANGRITLFAKRPAPVQVTYLGYPATTGLAAIDYRLTDAQADPPGKTEAYYTEKLWRLPASLWCYAPPADLPALNVLPAANNQYVTFGSFNHVNKVGPAVVSVWAKILHAVADSRLLMASIPGGFSQQRMLQLFAGHGIAASRLRMVAALPNVEFLKLNQEADIALDPFPCGGATSTCEALWMGLPVVSLVGQTFAGRAGLSLLSACGHGEWAAADERSYVETAVGLAADMPALAAIRQALRNEAARSPLGDVKGFVADLERAYRGMWEAWCDSREHRAPPP